MTTKIVTYSRVSTDKQGRSGLGLEAQEETIARYCEQHGAERVADFVEVESGKKNHRPELQKAIRAAKQHKAKLLVAKLDRLSRNAAFLLQLRDSNIEFVAADNPEANNLTIGILAVVAENEREMTSQRTKAALAAAKARGVKLGNPLGVAAFGEKSGSEFTIRRANERAEKLRYWIDQTQGMTYKAAADFLNENDVPTARGGIWHASSVRLVKERLGALRAA